MCLFCWSFWPSVLPPRILSPLRLIVRARQTRTITPSQTIGTYQTLANGFWSHLHRSVRGWRGTIPHGWLHLVCWRRTGPRSVRALKEFPNPHQERVIDRQYDSAKVDKAFSASVSGSISFSHEDATTVTVTQICPKGRVCGLVVQEEMVHVEGFHDWVAGCNDGHDFYSFDAPVMQNDDKEKPRVQYMACISKKSPRKTPKGDVTMLCPDGA